MLSICSDCRIVLRKGERHPIALCRVLQSARRIIDEAEVSEWPEGDRRLVEPLRRALEDLYALTEEDAEAAGLLDMDGPGWSEPEDVLTFQDAEPDAPRLTLVITRAAANRGLLRHR